jgi:branched-chain amino acid transport system permease protein
MADKKFRYNLRDHAAEYWERSPKWRRVSLSISFIAFFYALPFLNNPLIDTPGSDFQSVLFYPVGMYVLMAIGLNIVVGKSGLLDLGYVAFFAIGAYTMAILGTHTSLNFWQILPIGIALSMVSGVLLGTPTLRLRGDYLAIVTLGFGEIVRIVAVNIEAIGGPRGIAGIPTPPDVFKAKFTILDPKPYYWVLLTFTLLIIWMVRRIAARRPGRAWDAIRQDDDVAQLMGVNTLKYKVWAFVLGAAVAGAGGVLYASQILSIVPDQFNLNVSILILACVVFGGIGNLWGVILGAALLAFTPERIRFLSQPRILVFGIALVVMMNLRPDGILPKKKREHFDPNWHTVEESGEGSIK